MLHTKSIFPFMLLGFVFILLCFTQLKAGNDIKAEGEITAISENSITVDNTEFIVNAQTKTISKKGVLIAFEDLSIGQQVKITGIKVQDENIAKVIMITDDDNNYSEIVIKGELTELSESSLTVNGTTFTINSETKIVKQGYGEVDFSELEVGQTITVKGYSSTEENIAVLIKIEYESDGDDEKHEIEIEGELTELSESSLTVNGTTFTINSETKIVMKGQGEVDFNVLEIGQTLEVKGYVSGDENIATYIKIEEEDDFGKYEIEVEGELTELSETSLTVNGTTFTINSDTKIVMTGEGIVDFSALEIGQTLEVKGYVSGDENIATLIKIENNKGDDKEKYEIEVEGELTELSETSLTVNGTTFTINSDTKIIMSGEGIVDFSALEIGQTLEVKGYISGGENIALLIKIEHENDGDDEKHEIEIKGEITELTDFSLTVNSTTFTITTETKIIMKGLSDISDLEIGQIVEVKGYTYNGENFALYIKIELEDDKGIDIETVGEITYLTETEMTVNSMTFSLNRQTLVLKEGKGKVSLSDLEVGQKVIVKACIIDGVNITKIVKIFKDDYEITVNGEITALDDVSLTINDTRFIVNSETEYFGKNKTEITFEDLEIGMKVKVKAKVVGNENIALKITLKEYGDEPEEEMMINFVEEETLVVGSQIYDINSITQIYNYYGEKVNYNTLEIGMKAEVVENIMDGILYASKVKIIESYSDIENVFKTERTDISNYPNPFNDNTILRFNLYSDSDVRIDIFDCNGTKVLHVFDGFLSPGQHDFYLDFDENISSGVYYARLLFDEKVIIGKLIKE
jgi:hypothetical protein